METTQRNISVQVQFWALLGPFVALITMMVIFVKASPQAFYLSFATITGVLVSWKWKERGFLLSCLAILVLYGYQYSDISPGERLWHLGISFAIAIGFGITVLTYQEVDSLLIDTDEIETLDALKLALQKEQEMVQRVQQEVLAKQIQIESYHSLVDTARQEVTKISTQHQKLLKDFLDKQLQWSQLQEQVCILSEQKAFSSELEETVAKREEEIVFLKAQLQDLEHELARVSAEMSNQIHMEKLEDQQIVHELQEQIQQIEAHLMAKEQELTHKQIQIEQLEKAKEQLDTNFSLIEKEFQELKLFETLSKQLKEEIINQEQAFKSALKEKEMLLQETAVELEQKEETLQKIEKSLQQKTISFQEKETEIVMLQKALEEKVSQPVMSFEEHTSGEMRRLEGMHRQLKLQFEEKSATLDAARKALFHTQEKLSGLERECEEKHVYDADETTKAWQKYTHQMIQETEQLEQEVSDLQALISTLVRQTSEV